MEQLLQERMNKLLMMIYENDIVSLDDIMAQFHISDRTVRNDIKELNTYLKNYDAKIILLRKKGYTLESKKSLDALYHDISQYEQHHLSIDSLENRTFLIITYLLEKTTYASMTELCRVVYVSPSTMTSYLRTIKEGLEPFNLTLSSKNNLGYKINGTEQEIRDYIFAHLIDKNKTTYMTNFSPFEITLFKQVDLDKLYHTSLLFFPPTHYPFSDYSRKNLIIYIAMMINRTIQGHFFKEAPENVLAHFKNTSLNNLIHEIETAYSITITQHNRNWLLSKILPDLLTVRDYAPENSPFSRLVDSFIKKIGQESGLDFSSDTQLVKDLNNHLGNYLPIKANTPERINPLLDVIKNNYFYAFDLCSKAINGTPEFLPFHLTEHDVAYLSLHVTAAIERRRKSASFTTKIAFVCSQGVSISRLIESKIKQHFSPNVKIVSTLSFAEFQAKPPKNIDLIVSTTPIKDSNTPIFYFDILHLNKSLSLLTEQLHLHDTQHHTLTRLFDPSLFFHLDQEMPKSDTIRYLLENHSNTKLDVTNLTKNIMSRENNNPTNISQYVAIPHMIDECIKESNIMVLINNTPIKWDSKNDVNIIFMMLISPKDSALLQDFMKWLTELLENFPQQELLTHATTYEAFITMIEENN